jgi:hypothetical protein
MTSKYPKEVQEELMERSLTNVRALVDKIEAEEAAQRRTQKWVIVSLVAVTLLLVAAVGIALVKRAPPKPVVVTPEKLPPVRPGPPSAR